MASIPSYGEYLESLGQLTPHVDPTIATPETTDIQQAAASLNALPEITLESLTAWLQQNPNWVPALGLAVGLTREKLIGTLKDHLGTSGWVKISRERPADVINMFEVHYDLVAQLIKQCGKRYEFGDILVARAGSRVLAARAAVAGRKIEDLIENIVRELGLPYQVRTRFVGTASQTGPCDLVIPTGPEASIVVAAKGFDSTGTKLTSAFDEIEKVAAVRQPRQFVMAVVDGIGWKRRESDLRRIYDLWATRRIDGLYTLSTLGQFRSDLVAAAVRVGLLPPGSL